MASLVHTLERSRKRCAHPEDEGPWPRRIRKTGPNHSGLRFNVIGANVPPTAGPCREDSSDGCEPPDHPVVAEMQITDRR